MYIHTSILILMTFINPIAPIPNINHPYRINSRELADLDVEHGGTEHVTSVVGLDLQLLVHLAEEKQTSINFGKS